MFFKIDSYPSKNKSALTTWLRRIFHKPCMHSWRKLTFKCKMIGLFTMLWMSRKWKGALSLWGKKPIVGSVILMKYYCVTRYRETLIQPQKLLKGGNFTRPQRPIRRNPRPQMAETSHNPINIIRYRYLRFRLRNIEGRGGKTPNAVLIIHKPLNTIPEPILTLYREPRHERPPLCPWKWADALNRMSTEGEMPNN